MPDKETDYIGSATPQDLENSDIFEIDSDSEDDMTDEEFFKRFESDDAD
jgi:hypothetical protein